MARGEVSGSLTDKSLTIEDANIAAFLSMKRVTIRPFIKGSGPSGTPVIAWSVHGDKDEIEETIKSYYSNELVGISDFVRALKEIRGAMYNLKSIGSQS